MNTDLAKIAKEKGIECSLIELVELVGWLR